MSVSAGELARHKLFFLLTVATVIIAATSPSFASEVVYVNQNAHGDGNGSEWTDAYTQLQSGLAHARASGGSAKEIWVAQGTYRLSSQGEPGDTFGMVSGVRLFGGFAGWETQEDEREPHNRPTILTGDNVYHVVTATNVHDVVLDGFTIRGGNARGGCCTADRGGGMFIFESTLSVIRCILTENHASNVAGAVWLKTSRATFTDALIYNNTVTGNSGAGAAIHDVFGSELILQNTVLRDHTLGSASQGAGIFVGGNILGNEASSISATNCMFAGNTAAAGGAIMNNGFGIVTNSVFIGNVARGFAQYGTYFGNGGAIANFGELTIINCSFAKNNAFNSGGALFNGFQTSNTQLDSMADVVNTILWANGAALGPEFAQIYAEDDDVFLRFSCVEGPNLWGRTNIAVDPMFVDLAAGDLHLRAASPCIDAGNTAVVAADLLTDLDGNPRFLDDPITRDTGKRHGPDPVVDMGAYEFVPQACADEDGDGIVVLCHLASANPASRRTLAISVKAVSAHIAHGDSCGPCKEQGDILANWRDLPQLPKPIELGLSVPTWRAVSPERQPNAGITGMNELIDLDDDGVIEPLDVELESIRVAGPEEDTELRP